MSGGGERKVHRTAADPRAVTAAAAAAAAAIAVVAVAAGGAWSSRWPLTVGRRCARESEMDRPVLALLDFVLCLEAGAVVNGQA